MSRRDGPVRVLLVGESVVGMSKGRVYPPLRATTRMSCEFESSELVARANLESCDIR